MNKLVGFALALVCCMLAATIVSATIGSAAHRFTMTDVLERESSLHLAKPMGTPEQWFANLVDHFNPLNTDTYHQRFWINSEFYNAKTAYTPIFITLCCEGQCSPKWVEQGLAYEWASKTGALLVAIEHRYYGKSQPAADWTIENLRYLSMEQALADAAYFIKQEIIPNWNPLQNHPVVTFGGSYGGTMSASARHNYPNLIHYAVSGSGVFDPRFELPEFLESVIDAYEYYGGKQCVSDISIANQQLWKLLQDSTQTDYIMKTMPLCSKPKFTPRELNAFWSLITDSFIQIVQYNKEGGPGFTVKKMCDLFASKTTPQAKYEALAEVHTKYVLGNGNCYRMLFDEQVADIGDTKYDETKPERNMRQWYWQTLTEFGWYQAPTKKASDVFGFPYELEYFIELFQNAFDQRFDREFIESLIARKQSTYNQYTWRQTNVLFTVGQFDPWKTLHVGLNINDASHGITTYMVNNTSHCAPLYATQSYDPIPLKATREQMYKDLLRVLNDFPRVQFNNQLGMPQY